jgi:hypothetical protein
MRMTRAAIAGASVILAPWMYAAGCKGNSASGLELHDDGAAGDGAGSSSGAGSSGVQTSGSGGGTGFSAPSPGESGLSCGPQGGCKVYQECCYLKPGQANPPVGNRDLWALVDGGTLCTPPGSCPEWSSLSCSNPSNCGGPGRVCCLVFQRSEAGAGPDGSGDIFAPMMSFSAECTENCPTGDMLHYQLCAASSSDCPKGQSCIPGTYAAYCGTMDGGPPDGASPQTGEGGGLD